MPTSKKIILPESLRRLVGEKPGTSLQKIHAEASRRSFYRLRRGRNSLVAMVYPEPAASEVNRFCTVQKLYRDHGLRVPRIERVLGDQVVLQEDLGDQLLQRVWRDAGSDQRRCLLTRCLEILERLASIPPALATPRLDDARRKWEMDFFIRYFFPRFAVHSVDPDLLQGSLHSLVDAVAAENTFAHRDFHARNLLVVNNEIAIVDFQDSLLAPRYYDLVSLAFDSYLDLGALRGRLFPNLAATGNDMNLRQLRLTALQRNIKALGTFAFQMVANNHPAYARYIPRTLRHIQSHLRALAEPEFEALNKDFFAISH
ncbi:MAG TPA: phosphotransferase [Candidatus Binatia bacterium]|nr:phosphotransferase [Candidatus Binatia bacterium]